MRPLSPLTPQGVLAAELGGAAAPAEPAFPRELLDVLARFDAGEEVLFTAWELARLAPGLDEAAQRTLLAVLLATFVAARRGSTRLSLDEPSVATLLVELGATGGASAVDALFADARVSGTLVGRPGDYRPLILDGRHLYHQRLHHLEGRLVATLRERLASKPAPPPPTKTALDKALADLATRPARKAGKDLALSTEQLDAVRLALTQPVAVVTGGPGTGKTSILVAILRALARIGISPDRVALAAPTGKAAYRMGEATASALASIASPSAEDAVLTAQPPSARTVHRLLGYSPDRGRFRHHENNPLPEAVILVDESSMLDLGLMDQLLRALAAGARLVLFGDAEQLPSVEAGAVFRDLCLAGAGRVPSVRLTQSFRMDPSDPDGRNVLAVANRIAAREPAALFSGAAEVITRRAAPADLTLRAVESLAVPATPEGRSIRRAFLAHWQATRAAAAPAGPFDRDATGAFSPADAAAIEALFQARASARLLTVTREAPRTGAAAVNAAIHEAFATTGARSARTTFLPGEPVLMTRNDYDRGLWNGDDGVIALVRDAGKRAEPMAVFRRRAQLVAFPLDSIRGELELAWATTVHKAQGSEFDHIGVVLPEAPLPLLTCELLYTAVSRSRRSVVLVGDEAVLTAGVTARIERHSGVAERLARP